MAEVELYNVVKSYGDKKVVDDISLSVHSGEIFGLIGPNGAGKTTTIRMVMDIIKPDSGNITIFGESLNNTTKNGIGYLPEERGLYRKRTVIDSLVYLASLKGITRQLAAQKAEELLTRVDMLPHRKKKIQELSRGMEQIIQFLVTIIHNPRLIILDEPFANLDPVNTELIKEIILELRSQGRAIILSTHRMNEIEELCDRIFMISEGRGVLYGELSEIKSRYRNNSVLLECEGNPGNIDGVIKRQDDGSTVELFLDSNTTPQQVLQQLLEQGVIVNRFEVAIPSLNEIFLQVVGESNE